MTTFLATALELFLLHFNTSPSIYPEVSLSLTPLPLSPTHAPPCFYSHQRIEQFVRDRGDQAELEALMLLCHAKQLAGAVQEAVNVLNTTIAMYPWFLPGLTEKASILAAQNEWEQALDTVQRALDVQADNLDGLKIIAVHAFTQVILQPSLPIACCWCHPLNTHTHPNPYTTMYTQESQPHDALQKLEDLEQALNRNEPNSPELSFELASLFSRICARQPRALQIVYKLMDKVCRFHTSPEETIRYLCELGNICLLQGQVEKAMKAFQSASKQDHGSVLALQGMIQCQVVEGHYEDAEAQIELFHVMHGGAGDGAESMSAEFSFYQATLALSEKKGPETDADRKAKHLMLLERTKKIYLNRLAMVTSSYVPPLQQLAILDPDFLLQLSVGYQTHIEAPLPNAFSTRPNVDAGDGEDGEGGGDAGAPSGATMMTMGTMGGGGGGGTMATLAGGLTMMGTTRLSGTTGGARTGASGGSGGRRGSQTSSAHIEIPPAVQSGMDLLKRLQKMVPGMIPAYVEMSRFLVSVGLQEEACRNLRRCLNLQPHCVPALVAMAHVEISRSGAAAADRCLEQSLAGDFSIRSSTLFRLLTAQVRAQQNLLDQAIPEAEQLVQMPEVKELNANASVSSKGQEGVVSNAFDPLRLTDDDR